MEDDYSFESKATAKRNVFDDDASEEVLRKFHWDDSDEDFVETDNSGDKPFSEARYFKNNVPDISSLATPASQSRPNQDNDVKPTSGPSSFGVATRAVGFGHARSQSLTFGKKEIEAQHPNKDHTSTENIFGENFPSFEVSKRKEASGSDVDKMQQEIQSLKRSLNSAQKDKWVQLPIKSTLRRILKGEVYLLEMYKSLSDKLKLLDEAVKSHDGNAITMMVLFLQKTVTKHIFHRELLKRPMAANHYLIYLKAHYDYSEYINTLLMMGRTEEAAIFKYQMALPMTDVNMKISKLKESLRGHFQKDPTLSNEAALVQEQIDLLERQRPIDEDDRKLEATGRSAIFRDYPRKCSLVDMSVVTTLYYCCLYHYDLTENSLASPTAIKKRHQISDKQYAWTAIGARSKLRQWKDIETLLTTKGWFGGTKMKSAIGFDKVVDILHRNSAPPDVLQKYLAMIDNLDDRLSLAKKVSCHLAVIDALVALKKRPELEQYASKLDRYSKEGLHAFDVLNSPTIRWR